MHDAFTLHFQSDLFWLHLKAAFKLHLTSFKALNDGESSCFCVIALNVSVSLLRINYFVLPVCLTL